MSRAHPPRWIAPLLALALLAPAAARAQSPRIQALLAEVREDRIKKDVADLAGLGSRYALHADFQKATAMVQDRLRQAGLKPALEPFTVPVSKTETRNVSNVVAVLPGAMAGRPAIILCAHYDSISPEAVEGRAGARAPGAEDNASGTAALLELARVLAGQRLATEVRLVAFAAEEQILLGSWEMALRLRDQGKLATVQAVINMDMVGHDPRRQRHLLVDGFQRGRALSARVGAAAMRYTALRVSAGIFSEGRSDHAPFMALGIPSLTLASMQWHDYPDYHTPQDLPAGVDPGMVAEVARTALAAAVLLAGLADGPPVARAGAFVEARPGDVVRLSGRDSFDPRGQTLSYAWRQVGGPRLALQPAGAAVSFTPGGPGSYRLELVASTLDGRRSDPDPVAALVEGEGGCALSAQGPGPAGTGLAPGLLLVLAAWRRRERLRY
jgi:hypothetical protein